MCGGHIQTPQSKANLSVVEENPTEMPPDSTGSHARPKCFLCKPSLGVPYTHLTLCATAPSRTLQKNGVSTTPRDA